MLIHTKVYAVVIVVTDKFYGPSDEIVKTGMLQQRIVGNSVENVRKTVFENQIK